MADPLDHDGDGRKGGSRPRKPKGALTVKKAEAIHDGEGGFLPVGASFSPADEAAGAELVAKGLAE
ncbi:hypothetical protein [Alteraurantiacibacter buctensis]|uniref:Uncharacterized protein n=1 Tax=Alteraurantiacibacter buctensis TaxID=1503981 RepID=A0A844Z2F6_9SPHN|nr:hypothetical protein [Alteraurantiacibacter buctensis]MXO72874.1 hypothetical protein [Alteraurantiacibacter buctensis]